VSREFLLDPVATPCGHVFERIELEEWQGYSITQQTAELEQQLITWQLYESQLPLSEREEMAHAQQQIQLAMQQLEEPMFFECPYCRKEVKEVCEALSMRRQLESLYRAHPTLLVSMLNDAMTTVETARQLALMMKWLTLSPNQIDTILLDKQLNDMARAYLLVHYRRDQLVKDRMLRDTLSQQGLNTRYQGKQTLAFSPLYSLAANPETQVLFTTDPILRDKITSVGLNAIYPNGVSPLWLFTMEEQGVGLLHADKQLRDKISQEGLNMAYRDNLYKGISPLSALVANPLGRQLLLEDQELRAKINRDGLNTIIEVGTAKGFSPAMLLLATDQGQEILLKDPRLCQWIEPAILQFKALGTDKALIECLQATVYGRELLGQHSAWQQYIPPFSIRPAHPFPLHHTAMWNFVDDELAPRKAPTGDSNDRHRPRQPPLQPPPPTAALPPLRRGRGGGRSA